jgi:signal transduction histidine kinase
MTEANVRGPGIVNATARVLDPRPDRPGPRMGRGLLRRQAITERAFSPIDSLVLHTSRRMVIAALAYRAATAPVWILGLVASEAPPRGVVERPWLLILVTLALVVVNAALCVGVIRRRVDGLLDRPAVFALDLAIVITVNLWGSTQITEGSLLSQYADVFWMYTIGGVVLWTVLRGVRVGLLLVTGGACLIVVMGRLNGIVFDAVDWGGVGMRVSWLLLAVGFAQYIRLLTSEGARALVSQALQVGRDAEHAAMLREMHDTVLQTLESMVARSQLDSQPALDRLREMQVAARSQAAELRARLRRADEEPGEIYDRLSALVAAFEARTGVTGEFVYVGEAPSLPPECQSAFLGAVAESLRNVECHADARRVTVTFQTLGDRARVTVRDDGRGFQPDAPRNEGFGISGCILGRLRDVGGGAAFESAVGRGTRIELWVPLGSGARVR